MGLIDFCNKAPSRKRLLNGDTPNWIRNSKRAPYIISVILSTPPWVDRAQLRRMKAEAARLTRETGFLHTLDHIVPMNHPLVCGLTVPWNLRIVPSYHNLAKSNKWLPGQRDLFGEERADIAPQQGDLFGNERERHYRR